MRLLVALGAKIKNYNKIAMKVLLYGHRGWIGQQVVSLLISQKIEHVLSECRVDDESAAGFR